MRWQHANKDGYEWWKQADFVVEKRLKNENGVKVETFFLFVGGRFHRECSTLKEAVMAALGFQPEV